MKTLKQFFGLCEHQWVDKAQYSLNRIYTSGGKDQVCVQYHQQCSKCKKWRKIIL